MPIRLSGQTNAFIYYLNPDCLASSELTNLVKSSPVMDKYFRSRMLLSDLKSSCTFKMVHCC